MRSKSDWGEKPVEQEEQILCMRCGVEIGPGAVFCSDCLAEMEKHPVDPNTPINLPNRTKAHTVKRSKRRIPKPEEQISALRKAIIVLMAIVIVLSLALTAAVYLLVTDTNPNEINWLPGQNYGTSAVGIE